MQFLLSFLFSFSQTFEISTMTNTFYFEYGMDNLFDEQGERVYDPMEGA